MNQLQPVLFLYQFYTGLYIIQNTMVDEVGGNGRWEKICNKKNWGKALKMHLLGL